MKLKSSTFFYGKKISKQKEIKIRERKEPIKSTHLKYRDFVIEVNGYNFIDTIYLNENGIYLTEAETLILAKLHVLEYGDNIANKCGEFSHLLPIGVALYDFIITAEMFGYAEMVELGKSMFKKFYAKKYQFYF